MSRHLHETYLASDSPTAAFVIDYSAHYPKWPRGMIETSTHLVSCDSVAARRAREEKSFGFWRIKPKTGGAA
jgi:hypothetical protein